jgi:hypothetical protein
MDIDQEETDFSTFCRDHGVPSVLQRDNTQELKSNKVLDFNREHLIQDEQKLRNNSKTLWKVVEFVG